MSWTSYKLGNLCDIARGGSPRPIDKFITDEEDGINWIKIGDATRSKKYIFETKEKIKKEGISRSRVVNDGDFLLSNSMSFGRPYIMRTTGCIHDGWLVLSKYQENLDIDFFYYLLSSPIVVNQFENLAQGSTVRNLNKELVSRVEVKIPSLSIQKKIVNKLDAIFSEIDKATAAAEDNAKNTEALFQSYLSKIIKNESENSKTVKLGMICEIARGGSPRPIDKFITNDKDGINWIKIGDATRSKKYIYETREKIIKEGVSRSRLVKDGDFLLSNSMSYGRPYIMRTTGCIHDGWLVLSKYEEFLDIDFFYYLLSSAIVVRQFDSLAQGSTVSNLNKELVSRVEVKLPSLSKQKLIVYKLNELSNNVDIIKKSYGNKAIELLKLKNSILQKAFIGELVKD